MSVAKHVERWFDMQGTPGHPPLEINPFVLLANNPLRWTDPTGEVIPWRDPYDDTEMNQVMNPKGRCDTCSDYASSVHNNVVLPVQLGALGVAAGGPVAAAGIYMSPATATAIGDFYSANSRTIRILRMCLSLLKPLRPNSALPPPVPPLPPAIIKQVPKVDPVPKVTPKP